MSPLHPISVRIPRELYQVIQSILAENNATLTNPKLSMTDWIVSAIAAKLNRVAYRKRQEKRTRKRDRMDDIVPRDIFDHQEHDDTTTENN